MMKCFIVYGRPNCIWCNEAKIMLENFGWHYLYKEVNQNTIDEFQELFPGKTSVPQIISPDGVWIGGFDDLRKYLAI